MEPANFSQHNNTNDFLTLIKIAKNGEITVTKTKDISSISEIIITSQTSCNAIECAIQLLTPSGYDKKNNEFEKTIVKTAKKIISFNFEVKTNNLGKSSKKNKALKEEVKKLIAKDLALISEPYNKEIQTLKIRTQNFELQNFFKIPKNNLNIDALIEILNIPTSEDPTGIHTSNGQDIMRHLASGIVSLKNRCNDRETIYGNPSNLEGDGINNEEKKRIVLLRFEKHLLQLESIIRQDQDDYTLLNNIKDFIQALAVDVTVDLDTLGEPFQSQIEMWRHSTNRAEQKLAQLLLPLNQSFYVKPSGFIMQMINNKTPKAAHVNPQKNDTGENSPRRERWPDRILRLGEARFTAKGDKKIDYEISDDEVSVKVCYELVQTHTLEGNKLENNSKEAIKIFLTTKLMTSVPHFDDWDMSIHSIIFTQHGDEEIVEKINRLINNTHPKFTASVMLPNNKVLERKISKEFNQSTQERQQAFLKSL